MGFKVQKKMCATCIYRPDSPLDIEELERQVKDPHIGFKGHRICHHASEACCAGFWAKHKDEFPMGQVAQRLNMVEYVEIDELAPKIRTTFLDYETRREPKTTLFCAKCQRDINPKHKYRWIYLLDDMTVVHPEDLAKRTPSAKDFGWKPIGNDCAKQLGVEWTVAERPK